MADRQLTPKPQLTLETLNFLCELLSTVTVSASAADFTELATKVSKAKDELIAAVTALDVDL